MAGVLINKDDINKLKINNKIKNIKTTNINSKTSNKKDNEKDETNNAKRIITKGISPNLSNYVSFLDNVVFKNIKQDLEKLQIYLVEDIKSLLKKNNIIYVLLCLVPIVFGIAFYTELPNNVPISFISGKAFGFANKNIAIFALPLFFGVLEFFILFFTNFHSIEINNSKKLLKFLNLFLPFLSILCSMFLTIYSIGFKRYINKAIFSLIGLVILVFGFAFNMKYTTFVKIFKSTMTQKKFNCLFKFLKVFCSIIGTLLICLVFLF